MHDIVNVYRENGAAVGAMSMSEGMSTVESAIEAFRRGEMVVVVDDDDRENEGDLIQAAEHATAESINFMARFACGLICVAMSGERLDQLQIPLMVQHNQTPHHTAFTVSVEAAQGVATGISAADRARTIQVLADPRSAPADLVQPGHVFPLRARPGGVLARPGHTEAGVDLAQLAGLQPAATICEIMNEDGSMARLPDLLRFAAHHQLHIISVKQLIDYRKREQQPVTQLSQSLMPTDHGIFRIHVYEDRNDGQQHIALTLGEWHSHEPVLVRVHSECLTGDLFGSHRCDCGDQLQTAMQRIAAAGQGVVVYLRQEGRGIGLANKIRAYALQEQGLDTVEANEALGFPADLRQYDAAAQILRKLGVDNVHLLTNNVDKVTALQKRGLAVERVPIVMAAGVHNRQYLDTKREKLGHLLG